MTVIPADFAKVELHLHLDGALRFDTIFDLLKQKNIDIGCSNIEALKEKIVTTTSSSLEHVLQSFYYFLPAIIGDVDAIERVAYELVEDQAKIGVVYFEARFSPHLISNTSESDIMNITKYYDKGPVDPDMVVAAVLKGLQRGEKAFDVKVRVILCAISGHGHWSEEILALALKYRDSGVVGIDIAGSAHCGAYERYEAVNKAVFTKAKKAGVRRTVHAGESGTWLNVKNAIEELHAERIGHGYHALDNDDLYTQMKKDAMHFETCPTSSRCTGAVNGSWKEHPIVRLAADDANFSISSDDPTCFGRNIADEFELCRSEMQLTLKQLARCQVNAADAAFLPEEEKTLLVTDVKRRLAMYLDDVIQTIYNIYSFLHVCLSSPWRHDVNAYYLFACCQ